MTDSCEHPNCYARGPHACLPELFMAIASDEMLLEICWNAYMLYLTEEENPQ